jgi:hypothetical protein
MQARSGQSFVGNVGLMAEPLDAFALRPVFGNQTIVGLPIPVGDKPPPGGHGGKLERQLCSVVSGWKSRLRISRLILTAGTGTATEGGPVRHGSGGTSRAWESEPGVKRTLRTAFSPDAYCDSRLIIFRCARDRANPRTASVYHRAHPWRGKTAPAPRVRVRANAECPSDLSRAGSGPAPRICDHSAPTFPFSPVRPQGYRLACIEEQRRNMSVRRVRSGRQEDPHLPLSSKG